MRYFSGRARYETRRGCYTDLYSDAGLSCVLQGGAVVTVLAEIGVYVIGAVMVAPWVFLAGGVLKVLVQGDVNY